jgi:hypothetical protein
MNKEALEDLYTLFVNNGYKNSMSEFITLLNENEDAYSDAFTIFKNAGYRDGEAEFATLIGIERPLKKKEEGMVSPSEDGSLVSSETEVVEGAVLSDNTLDKKVDWNATAERESAIINEEQKKESTSGFVSEQAIFGKGGSKADTEVKDPFATTGEMTEKDFFTGTFGDVLRKIDQFSPIDVGDFIDDQARAIASGFKQGELSENASDLLLRGANASDEDIESYLEALRESQKYGASDEFMEFQKIYQKNGEGFLGFVLGIAQTSQSVIPEILLNSFAAMLANKDSRYAFEATVLGGAGIGGASGSAGGPAGIAAGASVGAVGSLPYAFAASGTALEVGATFSELLLEEAGDRELTKEVITEILNDEEAYKRIRNKAIARGLTIGVIDAITGKMGSRFTTGILTKGGTQSVKQATKKDILKSIMGSSLIEGAGGSIGEATARALIGQDMDIAEIGLEGIAEVPGSAISFAQTALSSPTYKVNGEFVEREVIDDLISTMTLDEIAQGNIEISNDYSGMEFKLQEKIKKLKTEADIILANPNINKPTLDKIAELQLELDKLKGNDTEVAKDKSASIRAEIKNLQENQLEDTVDETTKTSYESLSAEDKMDLRTKALDELEKEGVESPTNEDIDNKAVSILDKELQLLGQKSQKKKQSFAEGLGETTDLGDVMEGGVQVNMDGTNVIITEDKDGVTIESIETEEGKKGQGKAEAAVKQITEKADKNGVDVKLKLVPKDNTVDAKRLQALYERNGFKMQEDGVTMVRSIEFDNVSDNLFINRKDSSPILGLIPQKIRSFSMTAARLASKTLSKIAPEVKIVLHESQNEYSKYAKGEGSSSGEYNPETNTIHINLSNVKRSTVAHEVFHAVLLNKVKNNDALAKKISDDMVRAVQRRLPKNNKLRIAVEEHAAKYQGDQAQFQTEEQIAELIGLLSSVEGGYTQLDSDMKSVIKRFFLNIAKKLNIPLPKNWGSDQDVVDLINTLARKTRTGEAITEEDVKLLDVKEDTEVDSEAKSRQQIASKASSVEMFKNPDILQPKRMANGRTKVIDLGIAFDKRARDNGYYIPIPKDGVYTDSQLNKIADAMTDDAELQLKQDDSGIGWYDLKTKSAMELMSRIHPELSNSNSKAHLEFTLMVALISQNNSVGINFRQANDAYTYYKNNNKLPDREYAGKSGNIIKQNIALAFEAIKSKGWENYKNTLQETKTVKEWEAEGYKVNGENKTTEITGAMTMLGSKIGSFWGNLNGDFSTLTADLWFSRMFNRYTGNVVSKKGSEKSKQATLNELKKYKGKTLLYGYKKSDILKGTEVFDKWLNTIVKEYANGGYKDKQPLNIVSNTHFKNTEGELQDIPRGGKERNTMRDVVKRVQDKLIERGYPKLDIADIQAILWYNEKDLYRLYKAVNKSSEKTDYETAAQEVLREQGINAEVALPFKASKSSTDGGRKQTDTVQSKSVYSEIKTTTRQQKGIQEVRENGEVIETDSELVFFKGMQPKMKNGKPFSVHTIDKGRFVALDKNIALDYKGNKPLKQFKVPKGTTVQVVNVPSDSITKYRKAEEKAINESDAQIVKLITIDARGRSEQYVIKDPALLKTATDVKEVSAKTQEKQTSRARQQKGLINFTEKDAIKYSKIGINDARTIQAMENIGLSGVKFTDEGVNKKIKESLNELYSKADSYLLNEDSDEITRLMNFEIEAAINDGQPERVIDQLKSQVDNKGARDRFISQLKNTQEETLNQWVSYLKQSDYSDAFKYLMLDAVLTHNYDLKSLNYRKRTNKTSRNISPFDAGTLAMVYASDSKNLLKSYVEMQQENLDNIINASQVDKTSEGKWLKFDGGPNAENINETATALSQLVQDTYWCTKTNALGQLNGGDFYVYVTDKSPRIAIRMEGDKVGEVRGNASSKQDLEPEMLPVAETFLKENIPNNSGKKWLDSIEFNKKAKEFIERVKNGIGEKEIFEYLNIVSEGTKYNTDYGENGFVEKAKSIFRDKNYYNEDILDRVAFNADDFDTDKTEYFMGNMYFRAFDIPSLGKLKAIGGSAIFENSQITDLGQLQSIGGNADFENSQVKSLGQLQSIGGHAYFEESQVQSLGQLQSIGRDATFRSSQVQSLGQLQSIGGTAIFRKSQVQSLGQLQSIGRSADFRDSQIDNLGQLQSIGGDAFFRNSQVTDLGQLQSIGDSAYFGDSQIDNLGQLQSIGGDADFRYSQVKSLGQLQSIGGDADFEKLSG